MILYDSLGNEVRQLHALGGETVTDTRTIVRAISALNGTVDVGIANENSCTIDVRGTFTATLICQGTINGSDYFQIPLLVPNTEIWQVNVTAAGSFLAHLPAGCKQVRILCTAYTSGSASIYMRCATGDNIVYAKPIPSTTIATTTGTAGAAVTLTVAAPGAGLSHYITGIYITKFAAALLTAAATPVLVTTTNIGGSPVFSFSAAADPQGTAVEIVRQFGGNPLKSAAQNTATTIVCPATTATIWRVQVAYYVGA